MNQPEDERLRRWRLLLGEGTEPTLPSLDAEDQQVDRVLSQVYDAERTAGLGGSTRRLPAGWGTFVRISRRPSFECCSATPWSVLA